MSFGILQRKVEPPKPKLKTFADFDAGSELVVVIDPTDSSQTITPEHGQLLTIESDATRRTFLFDRFNGKANPCAVCDVAQAGSDYKKRVCDHMMCVVNGVRGIEFVQSNGKWTPLNPLRRRFLDAGRPDDVGAPLPSVAAKTNRSDDEPRSSRGCEAQDGVARVDALAAAAPSADSRPRRDRRADWEAALRELEERSRAELVRAEDMKKKARQHEKLAKDLRSKIFELLSGGSENYESKTPLFDALKEFGEDQNERPGKN